MPPEGNCGMADPSFGSIKMHLLLHRDPKQDLALIGAAGGIRTPDSLVRSQVLYPAELRPHF